MKLLKFLWDVIVNTLKPVVGFLKLGLYPLRHPARFMLLIVLAMLALGATWLYPHRERIQTTLTDAGELVTWVKETAPGD